MYPFEGPVNFPRNQWWVAATAEELGRIPFERTIAGERIVFYRTEAGEPVAMFALCPHRHYPLVRGRRMGDGIQCGYHGFSFDRHGRCTGIPSQRTAPSGFRTRVFPLQERGPWIWIWMGEAADADPAKLPDVAALGLGNAGWQVIALPAMDLSARYTLLIDNLLDLSHITFVHAKTIPGGEAVAYLPTEVSSTDATVLLRRVTKAAPPNGLDRLCFPEQEGPIDTFTDSEYFGPALIKTGGARFASAIADAAPRLLGHLHFIHGVTPVTANSTRYFVATARDFRLQDARLDAVIRSMEVIGREDVEVLEQIEPGLDKHADPARELNGRVDLAAVQVRRRLAAQIAKEREVDSAGPTPR